MKHDLRESSLTPNPLREGPTRLEANILKLRLPFGVVFLHIAHLSGRICEVTYSMQGRDTNPEIEAILNPIFEGITQEVSAIRHQWDAP